MDANEVFAVVEWSVGGVVLAGLSIAAWLHRLHRELEKQVALLRETLKELEPLRKVLEEEGFNSARRMRRGSKR